MRITITSAEYSAMMSAPPGKRERNASATYLPRGTILRGEHERSAMGIFREATGLDAATTRSRFIGAYRGEPDKAVQDAWHKAKSGAPTQR